MHATTSMTKPWIDQKRKLKIKWTVSDTSIIFTQSPAEETQVPIKQCKQSDSVSRE